VHKLTTIRIAGFRGQQKPIRLDLTPNANFIIGRNGTGKTTLINMINAALSGDISALKEARFDVIDLAFKADGDRRRPRITIDRPTEDGVELVRYSIKSSSNSTPDIYQVGRPGIRRMTPVTAGSWNIINGSTRRSSAVGPTKPPLRIRLRSIYRTTWLSLQRGSEASSHDELDDDRDTNGVDQRLDHVMGELVKYFSRLDRSASELTQGFQKRWFLSFLASPSGVKPQDISRLKLEDERRALTSIFKSFSMDEDSYGDRLARHFELANQAKASFDKPGKGIQVEQFLNAADTVRLHALVEQWQTLQEDQRQIYLPKQAFIESSSDLLFRKSLSTDRSNQVVITSDEGILIPPRSLSSGEKQILIFLGETLLQEQEPYIFLADEPELSLHVQWQEDLVPSLLGINPKAQVIFATHSPDILNVYQNNVFQMEELID
jgi:energy-coupling factor transporter ATP-binding protein EcfA2